MNDSSLYFLTLIQPLFFAFRDLFFVLVHNYIVD